MKWSIIMVLGLFFSGCHTSKQSKEPDMNKASIVFGHGGGFTGAVNAYLLQEDGRLFSGDGEITPYKFLGKVDVNKAKQFLVILRSILDRTPPVNEPGNIYQFVGLKDGASLQKFTWKDMNQVPKEMDILYKLLLRSIPKDKDQKQK